CHPHLPHRAWPRWDEPQLALSWGRGDGQEKLVEQARERAGVAAAAAGARQRQPRTAGAGECAAVPWQPGVEREAALGQLPGHDLLERAPRSRGGAAGGVDGNAQPLGWDTERQQRVELGEARAQLLVARADHEQDGVRRNDRLPVEAAARPRLLSLGEEEADIGDRERVGGGERAKRGGGSAGLGELIERLRALRRAEQHRRPPIAHGQPALEQLTEGAVAGAGGAGKPEQRALARVGAQPEVKAAAERVELDQDATPALGGERGQRRGALARPRGALTSDHREHAPLRRLAHRRERRLDPALGRNRGLGFGLVAGRAAQGGEDRLGRCGGLDDLVDAEREQLLPLAGVEREADDAGATSARARAVGGGEAGEIGREEHRFCARSQHLLLELVRLGGARARLEHGGAAEEQVLDRALGDRRQRQDDRQTLHAYEPPCALAGGIGAVRPVAPSRSRSILPSELASASAAATDGSVRATVTGTLAEARSRPSGGSPTASTRNPRASARARAPAPLSNVASTVTRSPGRSDPPSARSAGTTSVNAARAAPLGATAARASGAPWETGAASSRPSTVSSSRSGTSDDSVPASPASSPTRRSDGRSGAPAWRSCAA